MLDVADRRPVEDILCDGADYEGIHARAGLRAMAVHRPLGDESEPYPWVSETALSPWVVYVLARDV